jgi:hypothetical protein
MYRAKREDPCHPKHGISGFIGSNVESQTPAAGWNRRTNGGCWQNWKIREANSDRSPLPSRIEEAN